MQSKTVKRLIAGTIAALMIGAMALPSGAAVNEAGVTSSQVTFIDTFTISEGDDAANLPAATFNYSIAPGSGAAATATTPAIRSGIAGAEISSAVHAATASGTTTSNEIVTADFSDCNFTAAGIYRYNVTEELGETNVADDIAIDVANENLGTYVLDAYVKKDNGSFVPYAYIMSKAGDIEAYDNAADPQTVTYADKVNTITNEYTTYNLTVSKTIVGDMAANDFDFSIDLASVPADVIFTQDGVDNTGSNAYALSAKLANGSKTEIKGLPSSVSYKIQEAVNQLEGYKVEVTDINPDAGSYSWIGANGSAEAFGNSEATIIGKNDTTVGFTNTLSSISPTGVIIRIAPYAMMLGIGVVFLLMSLRRRRA